MSFWLLYDVINRKQVEKARSSGFPLAFFLLFSQELLVFAYVFECLKRTREEQKSRHFFFFFKKGVKTAKMGRLEELSFNVTYCCFFLCSFSVYAQPPDLINQYVWRWCSGFGCGQWIRYVQGWIRRRWRSSCRLPLHCRPSSPSGINSNFL